MVFNQLRLDLQKAPKMLEFFFLFFFLNLSVVVQNLLWVILRHHGRVTKINSEDRNSRYEFV